MTSEFPGCVPHLTDGVVLLRAHADADIPRIVEQCRDADTLALTTVPRPYDESHAQAFLELIRTGWEQPPPTTWHWAIARVEQPDRFLGTIDLRATGRTCAETGFALHPQGRGAGLMSRSLRLLQSYVSEHPELGIELIRWRAVADNWGSRRVAWACGFTHEGRQRGLLTRTDERGERTWDVDGWVASWRTGEPTTPRRPWYVAPELPGDGLRLRAWRDDDVAGLPADLDPLAVRFLPSSVPTRTSYDAWLLDRREREAAGVGVFWAITDADSGGVLGGIHLFDVQYQRRAGNATLGVFVLPEARGRGVFGRALQRVLDHAFAPVAAGGMGLERVRADADVANLASVRTMLRGGMTYVGMTREERPDDRPGHAGERVDMCQLEVLAGDDRGAVAAANERRVWLPHTIAGDGVLLRAFDEGDAAAVAHLMRDPEFGPEHLPHADERDARRWIVRGYAGAYRGFTLRWAICPREGAEGAAGAGAPIGCIRAFGLDGRLSSGDAEIGYTLHPSARRRGIATAAARALADTLLRPVGQGGYGLRRVTGITSPEHIASQKVLEAAGLTRWFVDPQVGEPGTYGGTRNAFRGDEPSPDRWRYGRLRASADRAEEPSPPATKAVAPGRPDPLTS